MASRNVQVRVYDSGGRAVKSARVMVWVYQFAASGFKPEKYTDSEGQAEFDLDIDNNAEISISVNGLEKISRGTPKANYRITL